MKHLCVYTYSIYVVCIGTMYNIYMVSNIKHAESSGCTINLGGGFQHFLLSPTPGEDSQFD